MEYRLRRHRAEFHLKGTAHDHDQSSHARGRGVSIPGVGNVDDYLAANPQLPGEAIFVWHARLCEGLPDDAKHALLFEIRETYEPVEFIADGMRRWRTEHGLPEPQLTIGEVPAPLLKGDAVASVFEGMPDMADDARVQAAFEEFKSQNEMMWEFMTRPESEGGMGVEVEFWTDPDPANFGNGPYENAAAQAADLRDNRRIKLESGLGGKHDATMTLDEYDRFRAVHDVFGHAGIGSGFDRHGEYQAYLAHASMYWGDGHRAMASEYHGVNTSVWAGDPGSPGTGKSVLLPERLIENPWLPDGSLRPLPDEDELRQYLAVHTLDVDDSTITAIRYLIDKAGIKPPFAQMFDRSPLHFAQDTTIPSVQFRFIRPRRTEFRFNPNQPRDEIGRWAPTGASGIGGHNADAVGDGSSIAVTRTLGEEVPLPSVHEITKHGDPVPDTPEHESTLLQHMNPDGTLTEERALLHNVMIMDKLVGPDGKLLPSQEAPRALVMGGGPASGKSASISSGHVELPPDAVTVNPDEFKVVLPESTGPSADGKQGNGLADKYGPAWASITHEESSHLGKRLASAVIGHDMNVVIDKVSADGAKTISEIERLQTAGYTVDVAYVTTDVDLAVTRAMQRGERVGRHVPESAIRAGHEGANAAFLAVAAGSSAPAKLITTLPSSPDGSHRPPVLTATSDGQGGLTVHDEDAWNVYITRVPAVPANLRIRSARPPALVASSGTLHPVMRESRIRELHFAAMRGKPPFGITAAERELYDKMVADIAVMRKQGVAPDYPIDDIF